MACWLLFLPVYCTLATQGLGSWEGQEPWIEWDLLLLTLLFSVGFWPFFEELCFRGLLHRHLRGGRGFLFTALLTAVLFALYHHRPLAKMPVLLAFGVVMAALREWRGSLIAPLTFHATHNAAVSAWQLYVLDAVEI